MVSVNKTLHYLLVAAVFLLLTSCGAAPVNEAGLTFSLDFVTGAAKQASASATTDICVEYGIDTITANVSDAGGNKVGSGSWACSAHSGYIGGLPAGSGFSLGIDGHSGGKKAWSGTKSGLTLTSNSTASAGAVAMSYQSNTLSSVTITVSATGSSAAGIISYGATIALPAGITLQADSNGAPTAATLATGANLPASSIVTGKYTAATTTPATLVFGVADQTGFGAGAVAVITGSIAPGIVPPGASGYTVSDIAAYNESGAAISAIGAGVTVKYQ